MTQTRQPTGQPVGGQFAAQSRPEGVATLVPQYPPRLVKVTLQRWINDYAYEVGEAEFDAGKLLASIPTAELRDAAETTGDTDWIFEEAVDIGLVEAHNGPFEVHLYADSTFSDYLDARDAAGQSEASEQAVADLAARREQKHLNAHLAKVSEEAGLGGIMPAVFELLIDRESVDVQKFRALDPSDVTELYELLGPALDRIETAIDEGDN